MLINKPNAVGIDSVINKLQKDLFFELTGKKFNWSNYDSYHRAYRNKKDNDTIPEVYTTEGNYKEVLFDDKETVTSFFLTDEKRNYDPIKFVFTQGVSIIFQANLDKLFPQIKHRGDEELIDNVWKALLNKFWDIQVEDIVTGVKNVYDSLKISSDKINYDDISNFCVIRFNFKIIYINTNCKTEALK